MSGGSRIPPEIWKTDKLEPSKIQIVGSAFREAIMVKLLILDTEDSIKYTAFNSLIFLDYKMRSG